MPDEITPRSKVLVIGEVLEDGWAKMGWARGYRVQFDLGQNNSNDPTSAFVGYKLLSLDVLRDVLRKCEHADDKYCPVCMTHEAGGHHPDCALAAVLATLEVGGNRDG